MTSGDQRAAPVEWVRYCRPARGATERSCDLIKQPVCHALALPAAETASASRGQSTAGSRVISTAKSEGNVKHEEWMRRGEGVVAAAAALALALAWAMSRL